MNVLLLRPFDIHEHSIEPEYGFLECGGLFRNLAYELVSMYRLWSRSNYAPGFAGASLLGSLSTMMSKSMSFSVSVDMSFSKQKAYSPGVFAVKT